VSICRHGKRRTTEGVGVKTGGVEDGVDVEAVEFSWRVEIAAELNAAFDAVSGDPAVGSLEDVFCSALRVGWRRHRGWRAVFGDEGGGGSCVTGEGKGTAADDDELAFAFFLVAHAIAIVISGRGACLSACPDHPCIGQVIAIEVVGSAVKIDPFRKRAIERR